MDKENKVEVTSCPFVKGTSFVGVLRAILPSRGRTSLLANSRLGTPDRPPTRVFATVEP